jgi:hypothetical protein
MHPPPISGMAVINRSGPPQGPAFGTVPVLVPFRVTISTAAVMVSILAGVHTVRG